MRHLIIDTATQALSLALFEDGKLIGRRHDVIGRGHSEQLLPAIAALPDGGRADAISVGVGPGSFTGIRVGIAAARALAFGWGAKVDGFSSIALAAAAAKQVPEDGAVLPVAMTGGHGELFCQLFDAATLEPMAQLRSVPIADLAAEWHYPVIYGTGAEMLTRARGSGQAHLCHPDASLFAMIPEDVTGLPPEAVYGRGADAATLAERGR